VREAAGPAATLPDRIMADVGGRWGGIGPPLGIVVQSQRGQRDKYHLAYEIDARSAKETVTAGAMVCSEKVICYLV
jgi:hypothetical protein